jgi:hypothetical protein
MKNLNEVQYDIDYILDAFTIQKTNLSSPLLNDWLQVTVAPLTAFQEQLFQETLTDLIEYAEVWNEEELKINAISVIFRLAELNQPPLVKTFFERPIHKKVGKYTISVVVDLMLAAVLGKGTPKHPYFFMQEMKKEKRYQSDPEGQMLAAMIAAQEMNKNGKPLYGGYVIGRNWFFGVLEAKNYTISNAFNATKETDLRQIVFILRHLKQIIMTQLL